MKKHVCLYIISILNLLAGIYYIVVIIKSFIDGSEGDLITYLRWQFAITGLICIITAIAFFDIAISLSDNEYGVKTNASMYVAPNYESKEYKKSKGVENKKPIVENAQDIIPESVKKEKFISACNQLEIITSKYNNNDQLFNENINILNSLDNYSNASLKALIYEERFNNLKYNYFFEKADEVLNIDNESIYEEFDKVIKNIETIKNYRDTSIRLNEINNRYQDKIKKLGPTVVISSKIKSIISSIKTLCDYNEHIDELNELLKELNSTGNNEKCEDIISNYKDILSQMKVELSDKYNNDKEAFAKKLNDAFELKKFDDLSNIAEEYKPLLSDSDFSNLYDEYKAKEKDYKINKSVEDFEKLNDISDLIALRKFVTENIKIYKDFIIFFYILK